MLPFFKRSLAVSRPVASNTLLNNCARALSTYKPDIEAIKKLRAASEAPLKDVKNALAATNGDFPAAFEWLRKKGIASATAKAGRTTAEGLIGVFVAEDAKCGAMVEINSETDFVARNGMFQQVVSQIATNLAQTEQIASDLNAEFAADKLNTMQLKDESEEQMTVAEKIPQLVGKVGENIVVRRGCKFELDHGLVCSYLHNAAGPGLGRAAALVALQTPSDKELTAEQREVIQKVGHRLAMHVVAAKPKYLSRDRVPEEVKNHERKFLEEQVQGSGKPAHIVAKMVDGRLNKFFSELTLLDQLHFVEEGNPKVGAFLAKTSQTLGVDVKLVAYQRYEIGEDKDNEQAAN